VVGVVNSANGESMFVVMLSRFGVMKSTITPPCEAPMAINLDIFTGRTLDHVRMNPLLDGASVLASAQRLNVHQRIIATGN
jgi:hypothetical protein